MSQLHPFPVEWNLSMQHAYMLLGNRLYISAKLGMSVIKYMYHQLPIQQHSQAGTHWGTCPSVPHQCGHAYKLLALLSIANRVLKKLHKVLQIVQIILRLTKSHTLSLIFPLVCKFAVSSEVTLHRAHIHAKRWSKCSRFNATVQAYNNQPMGCKDVLGEN